MVNKATPGEWQLPGVGAVSVEGIECMRLAVDRRASQSVWSDERVSCRRHLTTVTTTARRAHVADDTARLGRRGPLAVHADHTTPEASPGSEGRGQELGVWS